MFRRDITINKYYKYLRKEVFSNLDIEEFMSIFERFKKLKFDYRLLQICKKIEKIKIPKIEIPIFRFFSMFLDFMRWLIYDLLWTIINGKVFKPYRSYLFCRSTRWRKNYQYGRVFRQNERIIPR